MYKSTQEKLKFVDMLFVDYDGGFAGYFWIIIEMNIICMTFVISVGVVSEINIYVIRVKIVNVWAGCFHQEIPARNLICYQYNGKDHITNTTFGEVFCVLLKVQLYYFNYMSNKYVQIESMALISTRLFRWKSSEANTWHNWSDINTSSSKLCFLSS